MRQIDIDLDVFSAIWAKRKPFERNENDVLRRLLLDVKATDAANAASASECDQAPTFAQKEVKHSSLGLKTHTQEEMTMGKIRWVDDIEVALRTLGGRASLHAIYKAVENRRRGGGRTVPRTYEAVIRRTLEDHSSDSANFRGEDVFALVGRGEWALR